MRRGRVGLDAWSPALQSAAAGCCGAAAAVFGKLPAAMDLGWLGRLACYAALFTCNGAVMGLYLRSLQRLPSTQATVYSNAANIIATGLLGRCLFGEAIGLRWLLGVGCVLLGLALVTAAAAAPGGKSSGRAAGGKQQHLEQGQEQQQQRQQRQELQGEAQGQRLQRLEGAAAGAAAASWKGVKAE